MSATSSTTPLQALMHIIDLFVNDIEDIHSKAKTMETAVTGFQSSLSGYESDLNHWITATLPKAPTTVSTFLTGIKNNLDNDAKYKLIKGASLSPLVTPFQSLNLSDPTSVKAFIAAEINAIKTFLAPLKIANADSIFSNLSDILTDIMTIPDDLDLSNETLVQAYQQLKNEQIFQKIKSLIEEITGLSLEPPGSLPGIEQAPEKIIQSVEAVLPQAEQQLKTFEGESKTISNAVTLIQGLEPLLKQVVSSLPLSDWGLNLKDTELKTIWNDFLSNAKSIEATTVPEIISELLKALVKTLQSSPFTGLSDGIQKIQSAVSYVIDNGLWIPLKVHWLKSNETLPQNGGLDAEWQAIQGAKAQQAATQNANNNITATGNQTTGTSAAGGTSNQPGTTAQFQNPPPKGVMEHLLNDAKNKLGNDQSQEISSIFNGQAFSTLSDPMRSFASIMLQKISDLGHAFETAWNANQIDTLDTLIGWSISQIETLISDLITVFQTLIEEFITLIFKVCRALLNLLLNIKIPIDFIKHLPASMSSVTSVNLVFILLAIPWEVVDKLEGLT